MGHEEAQGAASGATGEPPDLARESEPRLDPAEAELFARGLATLNRAGVPYLVAGAFAKHAYTGIWRNTKDLDVFLTSEHLERALAALAAEGFHTSVEAEHWLAKARRPPHVIDLIFGIGHGRLRIDDSWFERARTARVAGIEARLIPLEELIASKLYIAERYRYDGADVLHLILRAEGRVDWGRVLARLGRDRHLLLWHLVLFAFVYPGRAGWLPWDLVDELFVDLRRDAQRPRDARDFRGMLLDPFSYCVDVRDWGYEDRRDLAPLVDDRGACL